MSSELKVLRGEIEQIDQRIVNLIAQRVGVAREIAQAKSDAGAPLFDPAREAEVVRRAATCASACAVDEETVRRIAWLMIALCRQAQLEKS